MGGMPGGGIPPGGGPMPGRGGMPYGPGMPGGGPMPGLGGPMKPGPTGAVEGGGRGFSGVQAPLEET